jgi:uncharacterized protein YdcH (DUF465 family)
MNPNEYGDDCMPAPATQEQYRGLDDLIDRAELAEKELAKAKAAHDAAKEALRVIVEVQLPGAMEKLGQKKCTTLKGRVIEIKDEMTHSLAADRKEDGLNWLEKNGQGGIIKRELTVTLVKGQEALASQVVTTIKAAHPELDVTQDRNVAPATLKSILKVLMEKGVEVPMEIFKINRFKKAHVK